MKTAMPDPKDDQHQFVFEKKKDEDVGFITTYISREIHFHTSGLNCPHQVWKKLKSLFDQTDES